ncbi:hypothetical protein SAMN05661008_01940 [Alkalithermobacter thermoalcaliphilus JW-YL-7 = DSM 7308]|uniref:Uncharacterized protein n=1 Tax=Alkalithermobacter thermoalcaliphilus JW-YL-7 = DSM 7308 TaxID=1121328 RepID=A0A150FP44_CLOPD|nr:hypothetical protein JWYL7_0008 [[Clostridium] paradoxum JW-YL-7 = DSM 7308]SHL36757.1 hypothetical protein SAMN05661008_01940 [[Clostridium] paradoxum JW-YL-7 = DSM 7308]
MYVIFDDKIIDSKDIMNIIKENSCFDDVKDISTRSKRDDIVAADLSIKVDTLNEILKEEGYDIENEDIDDIITEYMDLADGFAIDLEEFMPKDSISTAYSYRYDEVENSIKTVFVMSHKSLGHAKLRDVLNRLLKLV